MSMNKIFSWTIGSFFRTIGRIIAYIAIGLLIAFILSNSKLPKISNTLSDIFFMKVDALSLDGSTNGEVELMSQPQTIFIDNDYPSDTWNFNDFSSGSNDYLVIPISGFTAYINHQEWNQDNYNVELVNIYTKIFIFTTDNSGNRSCEFQNNMLVCPLVHNKTYNYMTIQFWYGGNPGGSSQSNFDIRYQLHNYGTFYKTSTTSIIENQSSNTQSIIDNQQSSTNRTIEALTDSNTTSTEGEASSFFSNFSTSDNGGLSSIITAPLSAIQSLSSSTCSPLVLPLPYLNENLTLPCMRTIYESNFGLFMVLYDTITIGIISYWILVRIFNMVKDFKNPDHDEIEVVDL